MFNSNVEFIELGAIDPYSEHCERYCIYRDIESLSADLNIASTYSERFVCLFRGPDTDLDTIPMWSKSLCKNVRVILRYSELKKSLAFCNGLSKKGYNVFVQPMLTMRYTSGEIDYLLKASNDMGAFAVYIVDSYGYMMKEDIHRLINTYISSLDGNTRIGFHGHNNMNMAFANAIYVEEQFDEHQIILDSCLLGIGQGAGNVQTELLLGYNNKCYNRHYNMEPIFEACDIISEFKNSCRWGYSADRAIAALNKAAYKYASNMRNMGYSYKEIESVFDIMSDEDKQRYTKENLMYYLQNIDIGDT